MSFAAVFDMETAVEKNVTENDVQVSTESASDSVVVDKSEQKLVNGAADNVTSASTDDKTGDETRCKSNDVVKCDWKDITSDFIGACSSLELGELVHDSKYVASFQY